MSSPLRIAIAAHSFATGGGEVLPVVLANELKTQGHHVTFCVLQLGSQHDREIRGRLRSDIPVLVLGQLENVGTAIAQHGIQIFNSHNVSVDFDLYCRHQTTDVPYIGSLHGGYETVPDILTGDFMSYLNRNVDAWLYLSEKNIQPLESFGIARDKFRRSFNAVAKFEGVWEDREAFRKTHGIAGTAFVLAICSRATEDKGWGVAIEAIRKLEVEQPGRYHLVLIGDGPYRAAAEDKASDLDCVTFLGRQENPQRFFDCFDCALLPSTFPGETFPLTLIEAWQAGLPVIATNIGEIPAMMAVAEGALPGALLDYGQSRDELVSALADEAKQLAGHPDALRQASEAALATAERFSLLRLATLYVDLAAELLDASEQLIPRESLPRMHNV